MTGLPVQSSPQTHAGLQGLAAIGARYLRDATPLDPRIDAPEETQLPMTGAIGDYAFMKYALFRDLIETPMPDWQGLATLRGMADHLNGDPR